MRGQGDHLHVDAEFLALLLLRDQLRHIPALVAIEVDEVLILRRHTVTGEELEVLVAGSELLRAGVHEGLLHGVRGRIGQARTIADSAAAGKRQKRRRLDGQVPFSVETHRLA